MEGLCFVADVELVDVFVHIGIRYDFRATGAVTDKAADKRSVLEDSSALALGAMTQYHHIEIANSLTIPHRE